MRVNLAFQLGFDRNPQSRLLKVDFRVGPTAGSAGRLTDILTAF